MIACFVLLGVSFIVRGLQARERHELVPPRGKASWMYPEQAIALGLGCVAVAFYGVSLLKKEPKK